MSLGVVLQTIGIILMAEGSIIALMELWRVRLNKLTKQALREAQKACKVAFKDMFEKLLIPQLKEESDKNYKRKELTKEEIDSLIHKMEYFLYMDFRRTIIKKFKEHFIHIGILYIVLGATIQIVSLWL